MIIVQYHPDLVEQTIMLAVRRDASMESELHRAIDPLFKLPSDDNREARFRTVFADWFARLRLDQFLDETLSHFPRIVEQVAEAVVHAASGRKSEGAELFVRQSNDACQRTLVVQLLPESLIEPERHRDAMLRELQHAEDMLDEAFAYVPESIDGLPSQQQVVRDRYGVLWNIRVEAALVRRNLIAQERRSSLISQFCRAFVVAGAQPPQEMFDRLWDHGVGSHAQMLDWSKDPRAWLGLLTGSGGSAGSHTMGGSCPVCTFPTFDWYEPSASDEDRIAQQIRHTVPGWDSSAGICRQCAETYLSNVLIK